MVHSLTPLIGVGAIGSSIGEFHLTWLFAALAVLLFIIAAGRTHSQYLDAQEARWNLDPALR
jgi:hypothetical protein